MLMGSLPHPIAHRQRVLTVLLLTWGNATLDLCKARDFFTVALSWALVLALKQLTVTSRMWGQIACIFKWIFSLLNCHSNPYFTPSI